MNSTSLIGIPAPPRTTESVSIELNIGSPCVEQAHRDFDPDVTEPLVPAAHHSVAQGLESRLEVMIAGDEREDDVGCRRRCHRGPIERDRGAPMQLHDDVVVGNLQNLFGSHEQKVHDGVAILRQPRLDVLTLGEDRYIGHSPSVRKVASLVRAQEAYAAMWTGEFDGGQPRCKKLVALSKQTLYVLARSDRHKGGYAASA